MRLLISMALRPEGRVSSPLQAVLREVDWPSGVVRRELVWTTPPEGVSSVEPSDGFTASVRNGLTLIQPNRREILWIDLGSFRVVDRFSHPLFCDLHSIQPRPKGGWVVTSTGNESVVELQRGVVSRHWWTCPGDFDVWRGEVEDFRVLPSDAYKPHKHHPNYAFYLDGELWVTLFEDRECRCLTQPGRRIPLPEGPPHDGILRGGLLWFTTVSGHVVACDPRTLERRIHLDLSSLYGTERRLGWCRGIDVVGERCFVGMSMLRRSRWRETLRRAIQGEAGRKLPTRIVEIDLASQRLVREVSVGNAAGGEIYAVHVMDDGD